MIVPSNSSLKALGPNPNANLFYKSVIVYNFNPRKKYKDLFGDDYQCIFCGSTYLKYMGKRYKPAFCWSKIHWILYDRFQCLNSNCTGGCEKNRCFGTIDSMFLEQLPKPAKYNNTTDDHIKDQKDKCSPAMSSSHVFTNSKSTNLRVFFTNF